MAGLLDFAPQSGGGGLLGDLFNDPGARLGLGLLAASSPKLRGLGQVMAQQDQAKQQALQNQYVQSQIAENSSQAKAREQQMQLAMQQQQSRQRALYGGGTGGGGGVGGNPVDGEPGGIMGMAQRLGIAPESVQADLEFNGGKKISEMLEARSKPNWQNINGNLVNTNAQGFAGGMQAGMSAGNDGRVTAWQPDGQGGLVVGAPRGAIDTFRAYQGVTSDSKPIEVYNPATGRKEFSTEGAVTRRAMSPATAQPQFSGAGYAGGSAAAAAPEQLQIIQSEMNRLPPNHPDRPALLREMQRLGGVQGAPQSGNYAAGPSADEAVAQEVARVRSVEQAKVDITPTSTKAAAVDTARDALSVIDQALSHPGLKTATGVQGTIDPRNYIPGTDATNFRVVMDQIKGGVFLDAFKDLKGGGAITEMEGQKAEAAKARINRAQSPDEFVRGLNEYKAIVQRGLERSEARARGPGGGASGNWGDDKPAPKLLPSLPPANTANKGKVAINKETGERMRSNGMQWVKE